MKNTSVSQVKCIKFLANLNSIRNQIDNISSNPFLKSSWMTPWIETWCDGEYDLNFLVVEDDHNHILGFVPLALRHSLKRGRCLYFVGSGKTCADYMTIPAKPGFEKVVAAAAAEWLSENSSQWDRIELDGITKTDVSAKLFCDAMEQFGCDIHTIESLSSYRMELPRTWDEFMLTLSKNSRKKFRRQAKALAGKSQLHEASDLESLREGMRILEDLHTARWNSLGDPGCFGYPGFREFLNRVAEEKLESNSLSLIWMTFEGQPFAADIGFHSEDGFFTYQGGISNEHLNLEPGRAIIRVQIELAMSRGSKFVDFLRGDEPYKARYNTREIENVRYEIVGNNIRARSIQSFLQIGRSIKSLIG